jgi:hypothetical protein
MDNHFDSKRFTCWVVSIILFILLIYTTKFDPLQVAGGVSMLSGIYIAADTFRRSDGDPTPKN